MPILTILLAACGDEVNRGAPPAVPPPANDLPTAAPPGVADPGAGGANPQVVAVRKDLQNVHPINWDKADVGASDESIRVQFYDGIEDCYGLADVKVDYQKDSIVVSLFGGTVPGAQICIEIAVLKATIIELTEPVGGRQIVDGNAS